ncbi:hypothetical protein N9H63_01095 [bacterium]|nr:hypothetical protein [bacterium]
MRLLGFLGILLMFVIQCSIDENFTVNEKTVDLSELDSVDCVVWWEVQNDTLKIWTEEDERRADIERFNYIRSLDTTGWE